MHEVTPERLDVMIGFYRRVRELATRTEAELLHIKVRHENMGAGIDGIAVRRLLKQSSAELLALAGP